MEELNKTQLVLLMLFVSFVTSIATGIVTVTLLEQAPKSVTQQINRVVERTVERVVPGPGETKTINTTTQVVVSEDDLIIQAVHKSSPTLVRIRIPGVATAVATSTASSNLASVAVVDVAPVETPADTFLTGLIVSDTGRIIASPAGLLSATDVGKEFSILIQGTTDERKAKLISASDEDNLVVLDIVTTKTDTKFASTPFPTGSLSLGQTLVLLDFTSGQTPSVAVGRITDLRVINASSSPVASINLDATAKTLGDPLIDTNGSFAGFLKKTGKVTPFDGIKLALNKGFSPQVDKATKGQ
ncbi:MAG: hypothetical protein WC764_00710 [Candidatus Paceibacterota bacterium]|jgi:hypothetical protein